MRGFSGEYDPDADVITINPGVLAYSDFRLALLIAHEGKHWLDRFLGAPAFWGSKDNREGYIQYGMMAEYSATATEALILVEFVNSGYIGRYDLWDAKFWDLTSWKTINLYKSMWTAEAMDLFGYAARNPDDKAGIRGRAYDLAHWIIDHDGRHRPSFEAQWDQQFPQP